MRKTLAEIADACSVAATESKRDYRKEFRGGILFSRGRFLNLTLADEHSNTTQYVSGESWRWDGTLFDVHRLVAAAKKDHPDKRIVEVGFFGGFDYADSIQAYHDGDYAPIVAEWEVSVPFDDLPVPRIHAHRA
jgi:hypothetical protein